MSSTRVISNADKPLKGVLKQMLASADRFRVATAFLSEPGLSAVLPGMKSVLKRGGKVEFINGLDYRVSHPNAVQKLVDLQIQYPAELDYFVYDERLSSEEPKFHPKIYIGAFKDENWCAVVGSSNLTTYGLDESIEVNAVIRGRTNSVPIRSCNQVFDKLLESRAVERANVEVADIYRQHHGEWKGKRASSLDHTELGRYFEGRNSDINEPPGWEPRTQLDAVIFALQELDAFEPSSHPVNSKSEGGYHFLPRIHRRVKDVVRVNSIKSTPEVLHHNIRERINRNVVADGQRKGGAFFERGTKFRGEYRLTPVGRAYTGG